MCTLKNIATSFFITFCWLLGRNFSVEFPSLYQHSTLFVSLILKSRISFLTFPVMYLYSIFAVVSKGFDRNAWRDIVHLLSGTQFSELLR